MFISTCEKIFALLPEAYAPFDPIVDVVIVWIKVSKINFKLKVWLKKAFKLPNKLRLITL